VNFYIKDFIYNNGLVNLYDFLEKENFGISKELTENYLSLKIDNEKKDQIYLEILKKFFKDYNIVYQTDNDRWYFDEKQLDFILDKKFDTVGGQKNDLRNGIYLYKNISEFNLTREEVEEKYLKFCEKFNLKPEKELDGKLKVPNRNNEIIIAITLDEAIERFIKYFVKGEYLNLDSKIHTFEDGSVTFQSMLKLPKNYKINKWDALIYWFGGRIKRFFNFNYFIFLNSANLLALKTFKENLKIKEDKAVVNNKKISTNIDFYNQLSNDGIFNPNFYISKSDVEFEIKFFMYLFSVIYYIEEQYEKANVRRKKLKEKLFNALQEISFVIFSVDGDFKTSFNEYTKAYQLIKFFGFLKENNLFDYLADILVTVSLSQKKNEVNLNLKNFCNALLNFNSLRKIYYQTSFNILKNESKNFSKKLFDFENLYLKYIFKGENMNIHKLSKTVGEGIGLFCAELGDKDLLFKMRNVKNYKQMLGFFKDLKFAVLKDEDKAKFSKEFNESLDEILQNLESNWEIVRDYIAIYAIDKYRASTYAKNKGGK
jgi:predicted HicB family RNase H-like nuclease